MRTSTESGSMSGRKESVCGQIGVNKIAGTAGCTMAPPADNYTEALLSVCVWFAVPHARHRHTHTQRRRGRTE
jgi:hypothetical protein